MPLVDTPRCRHMNATGNWAFSASMNANALTGSGRSPTSTSAVAPPHRRVGFRYHVLLNGKAPQSALQRRHALDVVRLREHVDRLHLREGIAAVDEDAQVARQRR